MHWNNRVVRVAPDVLELREVYYNEHNQPMGHASICSVADDLGGLRHLAERLLTAVKDVIHNGVPVLEEKDFVAPNIDETVEVVAKMHDR